MNKISNHVDTLNSFVSLFNSPAEFETNKLTQRSFERDEVADDNIMVENERLHGHVCEATSSPLTDLFDQANKRSSFRLNDRQKACIEAMIDSVYENGGLFADSYDAVAAEYLPILGELKTSDLNRARVFLMHQGPVLGLGCRSVHEFKWVVARHFAMNDFIRDDEQQNRRLTTCFRHLMSGGKSSVAMFMELCRAIHEQGKATRRLGPAKVMRLLNCSDSEAELLCEVYEALPETPLA